MSPDALVGLFMLGTVFVMVIILFFVFRVVVLWYFRINQIADNLAIIADHYRQLGQVPSRPLAPRSPQAPPLMQRGLPTSGKP